MALAAAAGCSESATEPEPFAPAIGIEAGIAAAATVTITFVSDPTWSAQYVCLNASAPVGCPAGATLYGYAGPGWSTNLATIPGAKWIWAPGVTPSTTAFPAVHSFSKSFSLPGAPVAGSISISADDFAEVSVNGTSVGTLGSTSNSNDATLSSTSLHTFDLTPYLITGTNVITVRGENGDFSCRTAYSCNPGALVFGGSLQYAAEVEVAPVVTLTTLPSDPIPVGSVAQLSASFTDANLGDTHTGTFAWNMGSVSGTVVEQDGAGMLSASPSFHTPGVYVVSATVSDDALSGSRSSEGDMPAYLVVYDPGGSFVTGGGWIASPSGACRFGACSEGTTGKANFGFVSKYAMGATVPSGTTEFKFHAGGLAFTSTAYDWLIVAGARAKFKGEGQVNGAGGYGFHLTAIDGEVSGGGGVDRFRIKIWEMASGTVVYDNQMGESDTGDASTALGGGSIKVHK